MSGGTFKTMYDRALSEQVRQEIVMSLERPPGIVPAPDPKEASLEMPLEERARRCWSFAVQQVFVNHDIYRDKQEVYSKPWLLLSSWRNIHHELGYLEKQAYARGFKAGKESVLDRIRRFSQAWIQFIGRASS